VLRVAVLYALAGFVATAQIAVIAGRGKLQT